MKKTVVSLVLLSLLLMLMATSLSLAAPSGGVYDGVAYRDYNANGSQDTLEPGIEGITVTAYDSDGVEQGSATTAADGTYSLTASGSGPYRIEFTLPSDGSLDFLQPGAAGGTTVQFVPDGGASGIDVGFNNPADYTQDNPDVTITMMTNGDQSTGANETVIKTSTDIAASGLITLAVDSDTGSVWGLAYHRSSETLFVAAFLKRHVGFGSAGMDGIYAIDSGGSVSTFVELTDDLGIDVGDEPSGRDLGAPGAPSYDVDAYTLVGKRGLGDIDYDENNNTLWVVNLYDRRLYGIENINPGATPSANDLLTDASGDAGFDIDSSGVSCANGVLRPFAVTVHDDQVLVGAVCTGENSTTEAGDLSGHVLALDLSDTSAGFSPLVSFDINYPREKASYGQTESWYNWHYVDVLYDTYQTTPDDIPQPWLTDIEVDNDGSLVLGLANRSSHQAASKNYPPDPNEGDDSTEREVLGFGEILRVCKVGSNYVLEGDAGCPNNNPRPADEDADNAGTANRGPSGGEYYVGDWGTEDPDEFAETSQGGLAMIPGSNNVMLSAFDPAGEFFSGGLIWLDNNNGAKLGGRYVYASDQLPYFSKGSGVGDLELLADPAPLEIGNLLWCDADADGIQDPDEDNVGANVEVVMTCDSESATVTTDADGNYLFTDAVWQAANGSNIPRNASCTLTVDTSGSNGLTIASACGAAIPTTADANSGLADGNDDIRDSDGAVQGDNSSIALTTGESGHNNHTYDFGFTRQRDWGDLPDSFATDSNDDNGEGIGASHVITSGLYLGSCVDAEDDGQPDNHAGADGNGDDGNGSNPPAAGTCSIEGDDEDGIALTTPLIPDGQACVTVSAHNTTGGDATLYGWIDFNGNGSFDSSEALTGGTIGNYHFSNGAATVPNGGVSAKTYCFQVPDATKATFEGGETHLRFRLTTDALANSAWDGAANDGEVEDYWQPLACAGNYVWDDNNGTDANVQDGSDTGIENVEVRMVWAGPDGSINTTASDDSAQGDDLLYTATTNSNGVYSFCGLIPSGDDDYQMQIPAPPSDKQVVTANQGGDENKDSDGVATGGVGSAVNGPKFGVNNPIALTTGENGNQDTPGSINGFPDAQDDLTFDFGFQSPKVAIGNLVWYDANGNSKFDSEDGIKDVTLKLYQDSNGNGVCEPGSDTEIASDSTDADGHYLFENVTPSTASADTKYCVAVLKSTVPSEYNYSSEGGDHNPDTTGDHDAENGDDGVPVGGYVISQPFAATVGGQTTTDSGDPAGYDDNSSYMTVDFGFLKDDPTALTLQDMNAERGAIVWGWGLLIIILFSAVTIVWRQRQTL